MCQVGSYGMLEYIHGFLAIISDRFSLNNNTHNTYISSDCRFAFITRLMNDILGIFNHVFCWRRFILA